MFDYDFLSTTGDLEEENFDDFTDIKGIAHNDSQLFILDGETIKTIDGKSVAKIPGIERIFSIGGLLMRVSMLALLYLSLINL